MALGAVPVKYFQAIAAMSLNRVIGAGNRIPWHLPDDFKWFRKMTSGHVIVMGRKTFESIGKPLPNRETIVVSRSGFQHPGIRIVDSLERIDPDDPAFAGRHVFICGGAEIYRQTLSRCSDLYLTLVKAAFDGDAFFPEFEPEFKPVAVMDDRPEFSITHYRHRLLLEG